MKIEAPVTELIKTRRETERKNWGIIKKTGGGWRRKRMNRKYQMKAYVFPTRFWRGGWVVAFEDPRGNALSFNSFPSRRIIFSGRRVFTEVPQFFSPLYTLYLSRMKPLTRFFFFFTLLFANANWIFEIEIIFLVKVEIIERSKLARYV